jgi:hypothetical protein
VEADGLYGRIVPGWAGLPAAVRRLHEPGLAVGTFDVTWGDGFWARTMARAMRLPPPGRATPVELRLTRSERADVWARSFGPVRLVSSQVSGGPGILRERLDNVECEIAVSAADGALVFRTRGSRLVLPGLRVPIPPLLGPRVQARAASHASDPEVVDVEVEISSAWTGLILRYAGTVRPGA